MTQTNWELDRQKFEYLSMYHGRLPTDIFDWLKNKSFKARESSYDARESLVGHIRQEYYIKSATDDKEDLKVDNDPTYLKFQSWLSHRCFEKPVNMFNPTSFILSNNRPVIINSVWVNFQKKYEFNPPHTHNGLFSFIVFVNIPYDYENEINQFSIGTEENQTSKLYFISLVPLNHDKSGLSKTILNVDKSYEGKILIFPASLTHGVNPFYTSDDYRITISGNLVFDVGEEKYAQKITS